MTTSFLNYIKPCADVSVSKISQARIHSFVILSSCALKSPFPIHINMSIFFKDPPSPPDVNHDIMLRGLENSPMLSGYSDSPTPPSSVPEDCLTDVPGDFLEHLEPIPDIFADVSQKGFHSGGPFLDLLNEANSPDHLITIQEFINNPGFLDVVDN